MTSARRREECHMTVSTSVHPVLHGDEQEKSDEMNEKLDPVKPNLKGDWSNIFLLVLLYMMLGIPAGLTSAMPIIMQGKKNVTYGDQAFFSVALWPYTLKILWAPLVDALYVQKMGRRKSWLIPVQFSLGVMFLYMANVIDDLLPENEKPKMMKLVCVFFFTLMLAATQDIAVDGWALTMLKKNNVGYSSTCNGQGFVIGMMIGSLFLVLFTSENFCNKYLRVVPDTGGIIDMKSLFYTWGILFMLITTLIALLKKEKDNRLEDNYIKLNIFQNYSLIWDILKIPSIRVLAIALLTSQIGFAATDNVSQLKLIDAGVSKNDIMIINMAMYPVKMIIPFFISKYTSGPKPLNIYLNMVPIRLIWNIPYVALIYYTPKLIKTDDGIDVSIYYYGLLVFITAIYDILRHVMIVAFYSFFARICDSRFGGTYMTLLATIANSAYAWSATVSLKTVDLLTFKECSFDSSNSCSTDVLQNVCKTKGGSCIVTLNGYYAETAVCIFTGIIWFFIFRSVLKNIQKKSPSHWLIDLKQPVEENHINIYVK